MRKVHVWIRTTRQAKQIFELLIEVRWGHPKSHALGQKQAISNRWIYFYWNHSLVTRTEFLKAVSSLALKYFVSHSDLRLGTHGGVILRCCNPNQSNDWNHLWCLISSIPFLKFPSRLDGLTWIKFLIISRPCLDNFDGYAFIWPLKVYNYVMVILWWRHYDVI